MILENHKTQTPSLLPPDWVLSQKPLIFLQNQDESNPNGFDFLDFNIQTISQLLDPQAPPSVRVPLSVTAGVSPSRLLLAAEPGMVVFDWCFFASLLLEEQILESWKLGFIKKNLHRNIMGFCWGLGKIWSSNQISLTNWKVSGSLFTKISLGVCFPTSFYYLAMAKSILLPIAGWLGSIESRVPTTSALTNFEAIGIVFITEVYIYIYKSTIKFWKSQPRLHQHWTTLKFGGWKRCPKKQPPFCREGRALPTYGNGKVFQRKLWERDDL